MYVKIRQATVLVTVATLVFILISPRSWAERPLGPLTIQAALQSAHDAFKDLDEGKNADYIPAYYYSNLIH